MNNKPVLLLFISLVVVSFLTACSSSAPDSRVDELQARCDSLESSNKELGDFLGLVSESMDSILMQEQVLLHQNLDGSPVSRKQQLRTNLDLYAQLLVRQRERIQSLTDSMGVKMGKYKSQFEKIITALNAQLAEKDAMIGSLRNELNNKNADISRLTATVTSLNNNIGELEEMNQMQEEALEASTDMLNTAYVIMGNKSMLDAAGVLKGGGFLKKKKLDISNFDTSKFQKVDISALRTLTIPAKKAKILTQMPQNSYKIEKISNNESLLTIVDPTVFWSVSNFLVIQY